MRHHPPEHGSRRTVGYGDDFNELYRQLDYVGVLLHAIAKTHYATTR